MQVLFRADASLDLGSGHLVRCLTLADGLKTRGATCTFVCAEVPESLAAWIRAGGHNLVRLQSAARGTPGSPVDDAAATRASVGAARFDWLVVDHYRLGHEWEQQMRCLAAQILVIDDLADRPHACDVLLDQNFFRDAGERYLGLVPRSCRLLLGPRFALLRAEFTESRKRLRPRPGPVKRILISFGGADARRLTSVALRAVQGLGKPSLHIDVVIGAEHPSRAELETGCRQGLYELHVQTTRMAEIMAASDLAVGAGGSATWERCCLGLPSLVVAVADNQVGVVQEAARAGVLYALEAQGLSEGEGELTERLQALLDAPRLLENMSVAGMGLVDGRGMGRVLRAMGLFGVQMRPATADDARSLFDWRNHPTVRASSHSSAPLIWDDHMRWLDSALHDPTRVLLIGESAGRPAGVVRFDIAGAVARISIYAVPGHATEVRGADVLGAAEGWMLRHRPEIREFTAEVLGENVPSHRLFQSAGFDRTASTYCKRVG